jgi:hypothetical protein
MGNMLSKKLVLTPIANLSPTPYLVIAPNGDYWYHTITQLENVDYSLTFENIGPSNEDFIYLNLHYSSSTKDTDGDNIIGSILSQTHTSQTIKHNVLITKYTNVNGNKLMIPFTSDDIDWINNQIF